MYVSSSGLRAGAADYRWLLDRGYPETASLKLVGDRHRLDKEARLVLFRGVFAAEPSRRRAAAVSSDVAGRALLVDGYNELFTVTHYLAGRPVFLASDGLLRDAGAAHGRVSDPALFDRAGELLVSSLARSGVREVLAWFDAPVPFSAAHAFSFRDKLREAGIEGRAAVARSADVPLKAAPPGSAVATSDSAVVDALLGRGGGEGGPVVYDAARAAIEAAFGRREWLDFRAALGT